MSWLGPPTLGKFVLFMLVFTRVSGLVITAPVFGKNQIPAQVRVFLALALAALVMPSQWTRVVTPPLTLLNLLVLIGGELVVGLCLGLGVDILFAGTQLAGQLIGRIAGETMAEVYDPSVDDSLPILSQFLNMLCLVVFVCIGGHRLVIAALLDTFQSLPPGGTGIPADAAGALVTLLAESFTLGIRAAAPVMTSLLLASLVVGLIGRTLPQLNVMALGFGVSALVAYGTLAMTLGAAVWAFQSQLEPALETLLDALHVTLRTNLII
jgi:flagellar biosynthetic protein FliR